MPTRLVIIDPGHFHAALVQKEMYAGLAAEASVYAPLGPDLLDYLGRIARFNSRAEAPTDWRLQIIADPDFLDRLQAECPGNIAILSGRNRLKIERIAAAVERGLHVIADKPAIIRREDLPRLAAVLEQARQNGVVVADMMSGRQDALPRVLPLLRSDPDIFGEMLRGSPAEPAVALSNLHGLLKLVAGAPNLRPSWYFDIAEQGEGLADTGTHLVDRVHETLFPGEALDYRRDIQVDRASRWPLTLSLAQFREVTGEPDWPAFLTPQLRDGALDYFCNGAIDYRVRGVHVRLEVRWEWQTETGDDRQEARFRGSRATLEVRQGAEEGWKPQLYILPEADIAGALRHGIAAAQAEFPGLAVAPHGSGWRVHIPPALRLGHDGNFAAFTRRFIGYAADPASFPAREAANLLAKYYVTTEGVALSRETGAAPR